MWQFSQRFVIDINDEWNFNDQKIEFDLSICCCFLRGTYNVCHSLIYASLMKKLTNYAMSLFFYMFPFHWAESMNVVFSFVDRNMNTISHEKKTVSLIILLWCDFLSASLERTIFIFGVELMYFEVCACALLQLLLFALIANVWIYGDIHILIYRSCGE